MECILLLIEKSRIFQSESTLCPINSVYERYTLSKEKIAELEKFHRCLRDKRQVGKVGTMSKRILQKFKTNRKKYPGLKSLIEHWPRLSVELRSAIVKMVR